MHHSLYHFDLSISEESFFASDKRPFPYGVQIAVVEVDRETGTFKILDYLIAEDVGRKINPMLIEGQMARGLAQGIGEALLEECPEVRIVWSHLGGGLAMMIDRLDRGFQRYSNCPQPPSTYLSRCFYDAACTHGPAFDCARATFGVEALVYGTDEPHVPNATAEVLAALRARSWPAPSLRSRGSGVRPFSLYNLPVGVRDLLSGGKKGTLYFSDVRLNLKESFHVTHSMTSERCLSPRGH